MEIILHVFKIKYLNMILVVYQYDKTNKGDKDMVNLRLKPYNLDDEGIKWVKDTIANMTIEEKIGQLFVNMGSSRDEEYLKSILDNYHIGGVR